MEKDIPSAQTSFAAGAIAGLTCDIVLFPLDTMKTRVQSEQGFWKAGGFNSIYKGIGPTVTGSAPCAALFFVTYNETKGFFSSRFKGEWSPVCHMASATVAEVVVNLVKVPIEIVKQRRQTSKVSPVAIVQAAVRHEGVLGLYRGFISTVLRDVPFSIIQFPIWEALKNHIKLITEREVTPLESSLSGAIAGAVAGAATTPLDVAKTRIMLAEHSPPQTSMSAVLLRIYHLKGVRGLFAGFIPRTAYIFLGGGVFFGCYEFAKAFVETVPFFKGNNENS